MTKNLFFFLASLCSTLLAFEWKSLHQEPELATGLYFKTVATNDTTVSLFALPTLYSFSFTSKVGVDIATCPTLALTTIDNSATARLSGTKIRFAWSTADIALLSLGCRIPTGTNRFSEDELVGMGKLSTRQLGIRYADLFNSFDFNAALSSSLYFRDVGDGDLQLGLSLSYLYRGTVQPFELTESDFFPGQEFTTAAALNYVFLTFDRRFDLTVDGAYFLYGEDSYIGGETYQRGSRFYWALEGRSSVTPNLPIRVRVANHLRALSETPDAVSGKASDVFISEETGLPFASDYRPSVALTFASYAGGGLNKYGDATIFTVEGKSQKSLSKKTELGLSLGADMGSLEGSALFGLCGQAQLKHRF